MNIYVDLAKKAIKQYLINQVRFKIDSNLPEELLNKRAGVFVSIHNKKDHSLRGCIGTFLPTKKNIAEEIVENAIFASTGDIRFSPVELEEFNSLEINVDILSEPKIIKDRSELDPKKYGILIKSETGKSGILLPDLEGIDTIEKQVEITLQKGGISPTENINVYRFKVTRHVDS